MKRIKVKAGQCLADIALQELGSTDGMMAIAKLNNLGGLNADLTEGQELVIDPSQVKDQDTQAFMAQLGTEGYFCATALETVDEEEPPRGIGYDAIGLTNVIA